MKSEFGESHYVDDWRGLVDLQVVDHRSVDYKTVKKPAEQWPKNSKKGRDLSPNTTFPLKFASQAFMCIDGSY